MNKHPQPLPLKKIYDMLPNEARQDKKMVTFRRSIGVVMGMNARIFRYLNLTSTPYLLEDYRMGVIVKGRMHGIINLREHVMEAGTIVFVTPGTIVEPIGVSEDFLLEGVGMSVENFFLAHGKRIPKLFNGEVRDGRKMASAGKCLRFHQMLSLLHALLEDDGKVDDVVLSMVATITRYFDQMFNESESQAIHTHSNEIFDNFLHLVNLHGQREHQLGFYADKLCITSRYLGTLIQSTSGVRAKDWIDRAIISSAKVMLRHSEKQTSQIADELNFPNASFFCKYFKRITGLTPQQYRGNKE